MQAHFALPRLADAAGAIVPFYLPMVTEVAPGTLGYLGEDFAFCERLRRARVGVLVDTRLRVGHVGRYTYQWEDVIHAPVAVAGAELAVAVKKP